LSDKLSLIERGILITILLLKEEDHKLTLAKVKSKIKIANLRNELIHLQDLGIIKWSGYNSAKKAIEKNRVTPEVLDIMDFMNELYGTDFNPNLSSVNTNLINRLQNNTVDEVKLVVANRYTVWKNDSFGSKYLTPYTIFRPSKFDKYLEEAKRTKKGESLISAKNINLKNGDEITSKIVHTFIDTEKYNIRTWRLDDDGGRRGNGMVGTRLGRDVKMTLKIQDNNVKQGNRKEFIYTYIAK
jgi:uncharacterized phage protein (TIGR02220 family)